MKPIIPFLPGMPVDGIGFSWIISVNETLARGLMFGKDIIFTSGTLAPIYTASYSPQTDWIAFCGASRYPSPFMAGCLIAKRWAR